MSSNQKDDRPRCGAAPREGSERTWPCKNYPVQGEKRCKMHGGNYKNRDAKRAERKLTEQIERAVRKLDIQPVEDPLSALKNLGGEVLAWKNEMLRHVEQLRNLRYSTDTGEQVRAEVQLFERAMDRCASVLATIAKLNIDERLAAISEAQAGMLVQGLLAAFNAAGVQLTDTETRRRVTSEFRSHLSVVGG